MIKRHLIILMTLFLGVMGKVVAQNDLLAENESRDGNRATIYFDLAAGDVEFYYDASSSTKYKYRGKVFKTSGNTTTTQSVEGNVAFGNDYYVYQSQKEYPSATRSYYKTTGLVGSSTTVVPATYDEVMHGNQTWSSYITNNTDPQAVIDNWEIDAPKVFKTSTPHQIKVTYSDAVTNPSGSAIWIVVDGIWSDFNNNSADCDRRSGAIAVTNRNDGQGVTAFIIKGDNRIQNLYYSCKVKDVVNDGRLVIGGGSHGGYSTTGSLTVAHDYTQRNDNDCLSIIGGYSSAVYGMKIRGGTIFAGFPAQNHNVWYERSWVQFPVCVGGGNNSIGEIEITGGTLTAVSNGTSPAIGGGGGYNNAGGYGIVKITGGTIYAYSHGIYTLDPGRTPGFVPTTAIGGSSTFLEPANDGTTVTITGGNVYAESWGGVAIGGGSSQTEQGGNAVVSISGDANVTAKSVSKVLPLYDRDGNPLGTSATINPGTALGGGVGTIGGTANVTINGNSSCIVNATSMGGGNAITVNSEHIATNGGAATISVSGGTVTVDEHIGGGNTNGSGGNGGLATIEVTGGSLKSGTIGGGSATTGHGGDASIYVTGGTLDCTSIGGGNVTSNSGTPGAVTHSSRAGFYVNGSSKITIKSGSIGGGTNPNGNKIGKATAYINATNAASTIQGQFILCNNSSTESNHCYFTMEAGVIDNTNLGAIGATNYPRKKAEGGAVYMEDVYGEVTISGGTIRNCTGTNGGAIYMTNGSCTVSGNNTTIGGDSSDDGNGNIASQSGGAIYMAGGSFTMNDGNIKYNHATNGSGGGIYLASGGKAFVNFGIIQGNEALKGDGGGFYVNPGSATTTNVGAGSNILYITDNKAKNGAGAYLASGAINVKRCNIRGNVASEDGGGLNAQVSDKTVILGWTSYIRGNKAKRGGGIFANAYQVNVSTIDVGGSGTGEGNYASQDGGGIYATGNVVFDRYDYAGRVIYNVAERHGGGVYVESGAVTLHAGGVSFNKANTGNGGGIYAGGGNISMTRDATYGISSFYGNQAVDGGFLYMNGGTCDIEAAIIGGSHANRNKATNNGGAIFANGGTVNIKYSATSEGEISYNTAGVSGGGLYVSSTGTLNMTGNVTLTKNHVPADKHGGGVYLAGVVKIGGSASDKKTILVQDNFAAGTVDTAPASVTVNESVRNNVFLHDPKVSSTHKSVITVVENGLTTSTRVGFSVPRNYVPVIYCAHSTTSGTYLKSFLENPSKAGAMFGTVFDDAVLYQTVYGTSSPYHEDYIFLSGGAWVERVTTRAQAGEGFVTSDGGNTVTVSTPEALAYVISYVNGLNDVATAHTDITIKLANDINIGAFAWTPIAGRNKANTADLTFTGTFDGQGHTISNLYGMLLPTWSGDGQGLFGVLGSGAQVKDVCLKDAIITTRDGTGNYYLGGVAKKMTGATINGCVVDVAFDSSSTNSVMGGLVGQASSGTIENCIATPDMTGYQMGGLVGSNAGDLYNSYANTKFTYGGSNKYCGGLVGVNTGTVENCYARVQGTAPATTYFGYLTGNNANGALRYSYAPVATYVSSNGTAGTQTGLSTFGSTLATAYNYRVRDNQVATTNDYAPEQDAHHINDYQLKKYLNKWVEKKGGTYAKWARPTTQNINGDYPILKLSVFNAVAATNDEATMEYNDINTLMDNYSVNTETLFFYGSKAGMDSNSGSSAPLYIDEDAVLTQNGPIQAYVGVTIDNSACHKGANPSFGGSDNIDWHFFSSALKDSPIGLHYGAAGSETEDTEQYQAYVYPSWNATFTNANGYFPLNLNDYYDEWDLYAYCEPDYHWINLKRNSASHWHEDYPGIPIPYNNDTEFVPGKGYMVALKEEGYLQAYGTLNTNTGVGSDSLSVPVTCTSSIGWTTREGHNLLGNPYQSYLDFDAFASENGSLWNNRRPFYIIMDEDNKDYVLYTVGQSPNTEQASRFLHPHQGFMIDSDVKGWVRFDNGMRTTSTTTTGDSPVTWEGHFRGEETPCYPLVNLMATDGDGNRDIVTVELGRPDKGGALKQDAMHSGKGSLWCRYEDEDYALVFTQPGLDAANIRFACDEDAEFTMTWSTHNGEFSYLHLIDNLTGADIDCLTASEYKFSARESDYNSRFRLVFDYTGIDDHEVPEPVEGPATFAYYANGEIHLMATPDATAQLQIIDMTGRTIVSRDAVPASATLSTNGMAAGVYVLRLTTANGTRTQKIILN